MPIFMDYHIFPGLTIEEVKKAHMADKQMQEKYRVKFLQFWVNKEAGTIFCLIEAPDKKACSDVHQEANGGVACNIIDVDPLMLQIFMGDDKYVEHGIVHTAQGDIDPGYRYILILNILSKGDTDTSINLEEFVDFKAPGKSASSVISRMNGKEIENLEDDNITAVFERADQVIECALAIHKVFSSKVNSEEWNIEFRIAINYGQPVTMEKGLFSESIAYAKYLNLVANNMEIVVPGILKKSKLFEKLCIESRAVKVIGERYQQFIQKFFRHMENHISNGEMSVKALSSEIGISRPQLYRKMIKITGRSPGTFIRFLRMHRAHSLIREENLNISEIALEVGYNNPSYFSKCFQERFGIMPSKIKI